jgi:hypothetical protein
MSIMLLEATPPFAIDVNIYLYTTFVEVIALCTAKQWSCEMLHLTTRLMAKKSSGMKFGIYTSNLHIL